MHRDKYKLLDHIPFITYITNEDYDMVYANPVLTSIHGPYKGKKCYDYINCFDKPCSWCTIETVLEGFPNTREWQSPVNGKHYMIHENAISSYTNSVNKLVIMEDITELKEQNIRLNRHKSIMERAEELGDTGGFEYDTKTEEFYFSAGLRKIHDLSDKEVSISDFISLIIKEDKDAISNIVENIAEHTQDGNLRISYRIKLNNRIKHIKVNAREENTESSSGRRIYGTVRDVTNQVRSSIALKIQYKIAQISINNPDKVEILKEVNNMLSTVMDTENMFYANYNNKKNIFKRVFFKDRFDNFTEWPAEGTLSGEVVKRKKSILMTKEEIIRFSEDNNITLKGEPSECWMGSPVIIDNECTGILALQSYENKDAYNHQDLSLIEMIANEIAKIDEKTKLVESLKISKEKAEQSDKLKTVFLANMSHEIRTPLNAIIGFSELLEQENPGINREYLEIIRESSRNLMQTISSIIDLSKIESGYMSVEKEPVSVCGHMSGVCNMLIPLARQKGLQITVNCCSDLQKETILSDGNKIDSILINLVKNSIKFTNEGFIEMGCRREKNKVLFYVRDTGIGIPKEKQKVIFNRFLQLDSGESRKYEGSGLGLSIAQAYTKMLGGNIWVESEPGKGSIFYITLPS